MIEQIEERIDKNSHVPLCERLRQARLDAITSGKIPAGMKLPTDFLFPARLSGRPSGFRGLC